MNVFDTEVVTPVLGFDRVNGQWDSTFHRWNGSRRVVWSVGHDASPALELARFSLPG
jgi:hypothetical protein